MTSQLGTPEYLKSEIVSLRQMWGQKQFWSNTEKASLAIKGLLYVYANTDGVDESTETLVRSTLAEFDRRLLGVLLVEAAKF